MATNKGKLFEGDFQQSCEKTGVFVMRLHDTSLSWQHELTSRFTVENPCDFIMFVSPDLYAIECKSTTYNSMSIQRTKDDKASMIKMHQINSLTKFDKFDNVHAGFLLNWRNDDDVTDNVTYWLSIDGFNRFLDESAKKSINKTDCENYGGIPIQQVLKRSRYLYNIKKMAGDISALKKEEEITDGPSVQ